MGLREIIQQISEEWVEYRKLGTNDKTKPTYHLVTEGFGAELEKLAPKSLHLTHHGSPGLGNISIAPWIASFHPNVTNSATYGYYPVYLFSTDLKSVYLSLALGASQFDSQFGENKHSRQKMREAAAKIRGLCIGKPRPHGMDLETIDLVAASKHRYLSYEADTIYAYPAYDLKNLPANDILAKDYQAMLEFYNDLALDPAIPTVDELVDASVTEFSEEVVSIYEEFKPRSPAQKRGKSSGSDGARRSKESRKVGDAGELAVLKAEKQKLEKVGRVDLAAQVDHHAARGDTPGWDITSFDEAGEQMYIEVKATKGTQINSVEITRNEWAAANDPIKGESYWLYLVTNALSRSPAIEVMRHPAARVRDGEISIQPSVFELSLRSSS